MADEGRVGIILTGLQTRFANLMHETRHFVQDRAAGFAKADPAELLRREIDARLDDLRNADRFGFTKDEVDTIRQYLERSQRELDAITSSPRCGGP